MSRTYIPQLYNLVKHLCKYIALYDAIIRPNLPEGVVENWDAFVEDLNNLCAALREAQVII